MLLHPNTWCGKKTVEGFRSRFQDKEWDRATAEVSKEIHVTRVSDDEINLNNLISEKSCTLMGFKGL